MCAVFQEKQKIIALQRQIKASQDILHALNNQRIKLTFTFLKMFKWINRSEEELMSRVSCQTAA